jgi:hypothetical protein
VLAFLIAIVLAAAQVASATTPKFDDYSIRDVFRGTPAAPVLSTAKARRFRTELRRQAALGPNFAGHFTLARWGCGAGCVIGAIIDSRTGEVWFPKFRVEDAFTSEGRIAVHHSTDFRIGSELVVATGVVNEGDAGTAYFRWHGGVLSLIRFDTYQAPETQGR